MDFGGGSGGDHDGSDPQRRKKRYHRHTAHQIQRLEAMFKECPHPDEKQRMELSHELGLAPRQIKFWFQNRRTQMKAQHERADNCALRAENDRIRCENIVIREALRNVICPSCGTVPSGEDSYFDEQKLRLENAHLKEELDRVSSIAAKYIGRPISQLPPVQPIHIASLDLTMSSLGAHGLAGPSLDLDLLPGSSSSVPHFPFQAVVFSEMDKSLMADIAANALDEFLRLAQTDEPLWMKSTSDGRDTLNLESYERMFPRASSHLKNPDVRVEASRESRVVIMNGLALIDMFMDSNKWAELFPTIVSAAKTIEVVSPGLLTSQNGSLQLMYEELQVLSPLLPTREFYILRYCQQIEQGLWAIADVSFDLSRYDQFASQSRSQRLPSGCLIQDLPNGYSKVTWVEHVEIEDKAPIHRLYRDLIYSSLAFGAGRWIATLERMCERIACLMVTGSSTRSLGGVIPSPDGKRSMMKLAQRMVNNFCGSISMSSSRQQRWTTLSGSSEVGVRVALHKSTDPGQPNGVVLSAATTIWLPISPQNVFNFFKDERTRAQAYNTSQNNMLILQESCIDLSGSLIVYCPVDLPAINLAMSGEDPSYIPLLPSGFTISPDGGPDPGDGASSSSAAAAGQGSTGRSGGSLMTVEFQILVSSLPSAKLNLESVTTVNNLISTTVHQIKAALNCPGS
ncbi:homeobox-leucine zipper protein HDG11-like isoform X2 [Rhodamnia argentea]|uniref:Homeobox-leucine zipper protein HDG11-like isoform X2 n=1 Tax=Rhodamnia argentea TaxID=178133 RepID=A0A8B8Q2H4_9MYRT|nr:homeobox-leucine zipper protein HDG11-like isoform X2 [Rhodamnia argentea]